MNSPFSDRNPGDFRPRPVEADAAATERDKLRVTDMGKVDFTPKPVTTGPKESATTPAQEPEESPKESKVDPAHPAAPEAKSKETGSNTQPAVGAKIPTSSPPTLPRIPSKPSGSA